MQTAALETLDICEITSNAVSYWEKKRILYNAFLTVIVLAHFLVALPESSGLLKFENFLNLFMLAVIANVAYCAAYIPDVFAQLSLFRSTWTRYRWLLLAIGCCFAGNLAHNVAAGAIRNMAA